MSQDERGAPSPEDVERVDKVHWVIKGGGRWGLDLNEIAWSVRLDERGRQLFPSGQARSLVQEACRSLQADGKIQSKDTFHRLLRWEHEPW